MRTITKSFPVYSYDEMSEAGKERARDDYSTFMWESDAAVEDCKGILDATLDGEGWDDYDTDSLTFNLYQQGGQPVWSGVYSRHTAEKNYTVYVTNERDCFRVELADDEGEELDDDELYMSEQEYLGNLSYKLFYAFHGYADSLYADEAVAEDAAANDMEYTADGCAFHG